MVNELPTGYNMGETIFYGTASIKNLINFWRKEFLPGSDDVKGCTSGRNWQGSVDMEAFINTSSNGYRKHEIEELYLLVERGLGSNQTASKTGCRNCCSCEWKVLCLSSSSPGQQPHHRAFRGRHGRPPSTTGCCGQKGSFACAQC